LVQLPTAGRAAVVEAGAVHVPTSEPELDVLVVPVVVLGVDVGTALAAVAAPLTDVGDVTVVVCEKPQPAVASAVIAAVMMQPTILFITNL
jgi:hypothetical protein